ncbi:hypothetical protein JCM11251_002472 [Rhodosporidiobolus azoricus]
MAEDFPSMSANQHTATLLMGPMQAGFQVQLMVFAIFFTLFCGYWASGELKSHQRLGRVALYVSLLLNAAYTGGCFYEAYLAGVSQDRTYATLSEDDVTVNVLIVLAGVIGSVTEAFLSVQAGLLLPSRPVRILFWLWIGGLALLSLVGACLVCYHEVSSLIEAKKFIKYDTAAWMWLWPSAICDVSISIACAFGLRSKIAGFNEATDSLLRELMMIAFRTASYTSFLAVLSAVLLTVWRNNQLLAAISLAFWIPIPAFYGLSLFTFSASSRRAINARSRHSAYVPPTVAAKNLERLNDDPHTRRSGILQPPLQIAVHRASEVAYDEASDAEAETKSRKREPRTADLAV